MFNGKYQNHAMLETGISAALTFLTVTGAPSLHLPMHLKSPKSYLYFEHDAPIVGKARLLFNVNET